MINKDKLDDYFETFISVAIKNRGHLEIFLDEVFTMNKEEKAYIRELWDMNSDLVEQVKENEDISDMDKVELEEYALKEFDVDIDRRRNLSDLIEQVIELKEEKED